MPSFLKTLPSSKTRSNPPIMSYLRYSSGAILSSRFYLRVSLRVKNGLAKAPPAYEFRMGVSTSRKSRSIKNFRKNEMICDRVLKNYFNSELTTKSR